MRVLQRFTSIVSASLVVLVTAVAAPAVAMPRLMVEPYKHDADGATSELSRDPAAPTVFTWGEGETIRWWAISSSAENGIPSSEWHVRPAAGGEVVDRPAQWCSNGAVRFCAHPQDHLDAGDYEFWITATDDEGSITSDTYHIRMTFPPIVPTDYHPVAPEFLGKLVRAERTAFDFGRIPHGIVDPPEIHGCDNPSMFYGDGRLHFIFGDPNVYTEDPSTGSRGLHGALAFTDEIVPERGIDLAHHRNWIMDPDTGTAKSIVERAPGTSRANNTGGAIVPIEEGHRIWFALYDYGSGPRPSYRNYYRVAIVYSDDHLATPAVREESLVLWEKDDPANGPYDPDPYLGYHMRLFKDHLYMMIPREGGSDPVLLRCHVDDLDARSLSTWKYLISVDGEGRATWSTQGVTKGQISHADFPTVDFSGDPAGIVTSSTWNPYHNRWVAFPALGGRVWTARQLWGPYEDLSTPRFFTFTHFAQYYALFGHELLLSNNGEWIHHAQARSWQPLGYYGTYNQRLLLRDKLKLEVTPKTGVAGDTITIRATNDTGEPPPAPSDVSVTVDGQPASFVEQDGDTFTFTYELSGTENGGAIGLVDVAATIDVPFTEGSAYRASRDAALIVHHRNELSATITSPAPGATVSDWVVLGVDAAYATGPEELRPRDPEVKILKTELRHVGADGEEVIATDVDPPYELRVDTRRFPDGEQTFEVIAYGTLDRRGVATITLDVNNGPAFGAAGNLAVDGNMENESVVAWQPLGDASPSKISDARRRKGARSLLIESHTPDPWTGARQVVTGLSGGESLRLTGWSRLLNNYTALLRWVVRDQGGAMLSSHVTESFGFFRRVDHVFDNPEGNAELMIDVQILDRGDEGTTAGTTVTSVAAVVDDVVLRAACHPLVEAPSDVQVASLPGGGAIEVSWTPSPDPNVDFYRVLRRPSGVEDAVWKNVGEVRAHRSRFEDGDPPGSPESLEYDVVSVDAMGTTSASVLPIGEVSDVSAGEPPLRIVDTSDRSVVVEHDPDAVTYNVYADALGSYESPTPGEGSACGITAWTDNGDGTVTLEYDVPENAWIVVTASDACRESSPGTGSDGRERFANGAWPACGASG